ncbi:hypothetical protein OAT84_01660 [Gammaproteobacteria bacterium]|nr:hypothetical protein [Gammaproteobacteria bacterium]
MFYKDGCISSCQTDRKKNTSELTWHHIVDQLNISGLTRELAQRCTLVSQQSSEWRLNLDPKWSYLKTSQSIKKITQALQKIDAKAKIEINVSTSDAKTPHDQKAASLQQALSKTRANMLKDPILVKILKQYKLSAEQVEVTLE